MCAYSRHVADIDLLLVGQNAQSSGYRNRQVQHGHLTQSIENIFAFVGLLEILLNLQIKRYIACDELDLSSGAMRDIVVIVISDSSVSWHTGRDVVKVGHLRLSAKAAFVRVFDPPLLVFYFDR